RSGGLFAPAAPNGDGSSPTMPKSPERKRFGIYYTPPEFTGFIVAKTVSAVIDERLDALRKARGVTADDLRADAPTPAVAAYWRAALDVIRAVKVCDPACGSGAFLVRAYDVL